jgi:2-dehydropantoate 2-reductase
MSKNRRSRILIVGIGAFVLGALSNPGVTMVKPGVYEQRNGGNLLIGELAGGLCDRVANIAQTLGRAIETRVTPNLRGALWAKLLLNCSVTTIAAIAAQTMRQYMISFAGKEVFRRIYDGVLSIQTLPRRLEDLLRRVKQSSSKLKQRFILSVSKRGTEHG